MVKIASVHISANFINDQERDRVLELFDKKFHHHGIIEIEKINPKWFSLRITLSVEDLKTDQEIIKQLLSFFDRKKVTYGWIEVFWTGDSGRIHLTDTKA